LRPRWWWCPCRCSWRRGVRRPSTTPRSWARRCEATATRTQGARWSTRWRRKTRHRVALFCVCAQIVWVRVFLCCVQKPSK
jgi:hypothetical protein